MNRDFLKTRMSQAVKEMLILLVLSAGIGLIYNTLSPNGLPLVTRSQVQYSSKSQSVRSGAENPNESYSDLRLINRAAAYRYFQSDSAIFLDARPVEDYLQGHIPGAMSVPMEKLVPEQVARIPRERLLITYCSDPDCHLALDLANVLVDMEFGPVLIFYEGLSGWRMANYPTVRSSDETK